LNGLMLGIFCLGAVPASGADNAYLGFTDKPRRRVSKISASRFSPGVVDLDEKLRNKMSSEDGLRVGGLATNDARPCFANGREGFGCVDGESRLAGELSLPFSLGWRGSEQVVAGRFIGWAESSVQL
jgi:hypothetical protein